MLVADLAHLRGLNNAASAYERPNIMRAHATS
jgi:hypothetical protein